jgi:hypothetical protein
LGKKASRPEGRLRLLRFLLIVTKKKKKKKKKKKNIKKKDINLLYELYLPTEEVSHIRASAEFDGSITSS